MEMITSVTDTGNPAIDMLNPINHVLKPLKLLGGLFS
jgi:hypothetical protein